MTTEVFYTVLDIASALLDGKRRAQYHRIPSHWSKETCEDFAASIRRQGRYAHVIAVSPLFHEQIMKYPNTGYAYGTEHDAVIELAVWN